MSRILPLLVVLASAVPLRAEPGHKFPPVKPDELAEIRAALPQAVVRAARPRKLLVFFLTEGFVHASIPYCNEALDEMGGKTGAFTADFSEDMSVFTPEKLQAYDAVLFNNTTGLKFADPAAREALLGFVKSGKGLVGIHAATDSFPTWEEGRALLGGAFDGHPWVSGDLVAVKVDDPANPVVAPFGGRGFWLRDEIYQMKAPYDRGQVHELLSLDMSKPENARPPAKIHRTDGDFPVSWIKKTEGGGRVFYCSLGHNPNVYWTPEVLQLYLNGIQFALGDLAVDATPTAQRGALPTAALAPNVPDAINAKPLSAPAAPQPSSVLPPPAEIPPGAAPKTGGSPAAVAPATSADPLADGVKAVASYDYGKDRAGVAAFDTYLRSRPGERARVEAALLPLLTQDNVSTGAKDYVCRWLSVLGSDAAVPALEKLVPDPSLSQLAVNALLGIRTPAAGAALLGSLGTAPASLRPAIVGAVGRARITEAVPALSKDAASPDPAEAAAALDALGIIGGPAALEALRAVPVATPLESARRWAVLHAADTLSKASPVGRDEARAAYASLLEPGSAPTLRVAAARGCLAADPAGAFPALLSLLKDGDPRVRFGAVRLTPGLPPESLRALAAALPDLDPAAQVAVVARLAEVRPAGIEPVLQAALASALPPVHLAAVEGYGTANLPGAASVLLPLLAKGKADSTAAAGSLKKLSQPGTNARLQAALADAPGPVKAALLTVLAARQDRTALDRFLASTGDGDPAVRAAAFQGIEAVAGGSDLNRVVSLLPQARTGAERKSLNAALLRCARTAADRDSAADFLLAALGKSPPDTRNILLAALASIPSAKAVSSLQSQLGAPSVEARKEVIRAISAAHAPEADKLLLDEAAHGTETSEKVLALRGYLDSIQTQTLSARQKLEAYTTAWPFAIRSEERQAILDTLQRLPGRDAQKAFRELAALALKADQDTHEPGQNR